MINSLAKTDIFVALCLQIARVGIVGWSVGIRIVRSLEFGVELHRVQSVRFILFVFRFVFVSPNTPHSDSARSKIEDRIKV